MKRHNLAPCIGRLPNWHNLMDALDDGLRIAKIICLVFLSVALFFIGEAAHQLTKDLVEIHNTAVATTAAVQEVQQRVKDTSQNLNAILLQVGLISDEAERASLAQEKYWNAIGPKTLKILDHADKLITSTQGNEKQLSQNLGNVLQGLQATTKTANALIGDNAIKQAIDNVNVTTQNTADMTKHADATLAHLENTSTLVEKRARQLLKPASLAKRVLMTTAQATYYALRIFVLW